MSKARILKALACSHNEWDFFGKNEITLLTQA